MAANEDKESHVPIITITLISNYEITHTLTQSPAEKKKRNGQLDLPLTNRKSRGRGCCL